MLSRDGKVTGAELTAPERLRKLTSFSAEHTAGCLSLATADIRMDRHPPRMFSVGSPFQVVEIATREVRRARPDAAGYARVLPCDGGRGIYLYTRDVPPSEKPADLQARMFFPGSSGLVEDPATGSATVAAAAMLADLSSERDGEFRLQIKAGRRHGPAESTLDTRPQGKAARSPQRMSAAVASK
jgi:trans-2,3-dihydro-3-hydroxyanthranilate isomerase